MEWPVLAAAILLGAGLLSAGCSEQRLVVSSDEKMGVVSIISERDKPDVPPHPALRKLSPSMVKGSLRRIWVEPGTWSTFARDDATPYLTLSQTEWARDQISHLLPGLKEDQRIELAFKDQFKNFNVRVEIYPEGNLLVYLFTQLSTEPVDGIHDSSGQPLSWVALIEQPGQVLLFSREGFTLKDPVVGKVPGEDPHRLEKLELIQRAVREERIDQEEGKDLVEIAAAVPHLNLRDFEFYLKKRRTLDDGLQQGLFSQDEYKTHLKKIRAELTP